MTDPSTSQSIHSLLLHGDAPIRSSAEDQLGRAQFSQSLAELISTAAVGEGLVIGLMGSWGSGKTSILNLAVEHLRKSQTVIPLEFNPWLFSGTDELARHFFQRLGRQLKIRQDNALKQLGEWLEGLGDAAGTLSVLPEAAAGAGSAKIAGRLFKRLGRRSFADVALHEQRERVIESLRKSGQRILVVIDDIDRLRDDEIKELVRLVRLTASFPNTIYLLAFDRRRVEEALGSGGHGRAYLEKILQATIDVPTIPPPELGRLLLEGINAIIKPLDLGPFVQKDWDNVLLLVMMPLFSTIRDVKRYLASLPHTLDVVRDEVALADLLAIEAIRVLLPDVWSRISPSFQALTDVSGLGLQNEERTKRHQSVINDLIERGGRHGEVVRAMCQYIFLPSGRFIGRPSYGSDFHAQWGRGRRLAHPRVLQIYLEKRLPHGVLPSHTIDEIVQDFGDSEALRPKIAGLDAIHLENLIERLGEHEDSLPLPSIASGLTEFFNRLPALRDFLGHDMVDFGPDLKLEGMAYRLIGRAPEGSDRRAVIDVVWQGVQNLSGRYLLLRILGAGGDGAGLLPANDREELQKDLELRISRADPTGLASERFLLDLLLMARGSGASGSQNVERVLAHDQALLRTLRDSVAEVKSQTLGEVAIVASRVLRWDQLTALFGEEQLAQRIQELRTSPALRTADELTREAVDLAQKYVDGWRPPED